MSERLYVTVGDRFTPKRTAGRVWVVEGFRNGEWQLRLDGPRVDAAGRPTASRTHEQLEKGWERS